MIRRALAGAAIAAFVSLPLAGVAYAQTDGTDGTDGTDCPSTDSTDCPTGTSTTVTVVNTTARPTTTLGGTGLARTGGDWAMPLTVAGAGVAVAVGARRLARRPVV